MKPKEIRFELSPDAYGRMTELVWRSGANGQKSGFEIIRHEADQRDERRSVDLLTSTQLEQLGEIVRGDSKITFTKG